MNALRDLVSQFLARVSRICNQSNQPKTSEHVDHCAETVAQVQQALQNGEEATKISDIKTGRPTLRKTLHDMPAASQHTPYGKERHWFDKAEYDPRYSGRPSNTMNRLEAFLSNTDPDQLKALDPSWIKEIVGAPDDRPQPKQHEISDLPKFQRSSAAEVNSAEALYQEGVFSESIS